MFNSVQFCVRQAPRCWRENSCMCEVYIFILYACGLWLLASVSFPLQCVHLNTVCCLKETELLANDI